MGGQESNRYLRLQFELNQTMSQKEDLEKDKELYNQLRKTVLKKQKVAVQEDKLLEALQNFAQKPVIPQKKRKNRLTGQKIDNDMSNASPDNIERLKSAAEKYINDKNSYIFENSHSHGLQVKEAIKKFILSEPQPIFEK